MVAVLTFDRWSSESERKLENHFSAMGDFFDDTRPLDEQSPKNMAINVAINEYCGIESTAYALAVIRPDGEIATFVSDEMKTVPNFLFTPDFQDGLLMASGRPPLHHNRLKREFDTEGTELQSHMRHNIRCRNQINPSYRKRTPSRSHSAYDDKTSDSPMNPGSRKRLCTTATRSRDRAVPTLLTRTTAIGDDAARNDVYRQCLEDIQQNGCKVIGKAWVKLLEPKKQSTYPYTKGAQKRPPWWPAMTGPNKIRHKEPDHLHKRERIILLMHILGLIVSQDPSGPAQQRNIDVAKLEDVTREAMATWFADREKPKNAEKRGFLIQLFRVLYKEERYRRGELDGSTTVSVNDGPRPTDHDEDDDKTAAKGKNSDLSSQQVHQIQTISPFLPTPPSSLSPFHTITSTTTSADMQDYYPPRLPLRSSYIPTTPDTTTGDDYTDAAYPIQHHSTLTHSQQSPTYPTRAWPAQEMNIYASSAWPMPPAAASGPMRQYPFVLSTPSPPQQQGQGAVFLPPPTPMAQTYDDVDGGRGSFDGGSMRGFWGADGGGWEVI